MTDIATNLELLRVKEQQNATIAGLVEALKAQGLTGLDDIETKVQSSPKSRSEKVLKDLRDQFTYYRSPLLGSAPRPRQGSLKNPPHQDRTKNL